MSPELLPKLLAAAVLLPLISFAVILTTAKWLGKSAAYIAVFAIGGAAVLSYISLGIWLYYHFPQPIAHGHHDEHREREHHSSAPADASPYKHVSFLADEAAEKGHHDEAHAGDHDHGHAVAPVNYTGEYYLVGQFGKLRVTISYFIDSLTICMFCMVTLIATLIHCYAMGYMHDEEHDITDQEVTLSNGHKLHRPGRFPRFFQYLSLFCFSMLGLVLAGNIAMVFVFWELVGICSYFLIGFYVERKSASTAANKAFIVNRVGDFGMLIGLMALWSSLGTFAFGDIDRNGDKHISPDEQGIFSQVRPGPDGKLIVPDSMVREDARAKPLLVEIARDHGALADNTKAEMSAHPNPENPDEKLIDIYRAKGYGYWLLVVAGIGIFCGCVGKSAQFPLHTWLPDAMEGPTPVSALVHSATMVAAGVYLVGRFFPVFAPEALLVIAITGCITLFLAATIAITAVDIKRVLAYSTISQLGYMMLALGVGGWAAGLMHLITHAFFKSLLFMCSGSVIHAVHTNDMRKMGGLLRKMPVTALTMLIGCLAIAGVGVPFVIGFSGYYSKDAILEQALSFAQTNNKSALASVFFYAAAGGAAITAFYMFRMWYMTFVGKPRDEHAYDHAHESPPVMFMPLVILAVFATAVAWNVSLVGYAIVPVAYLIYLGATHGWFAALTAPSHAAHGHDDHGHGHDDHGHGHDDHGHAQAHAHEDHGHDDHGHGHDEHGHGHDEHGHGHDSPATLPQISWATLAVLFVATMIVGALAGALIHPSDLTLANLLESARPFGTAADAKGFYSSWTWPDEHASHADPIVTTATLLATGTWLLGIGLATVIYAFGWLNPADVRRSFEPIYQFLWNKWYFDELYDFIFVKPTLVLSRFFAGIDKNWIDVFIDGIAKVGISFSRGFDLVADRGLVDGTANLVAGWTYSTGLWLRKLQTGSLRQYVLFIVIGAVALFVLISLFWNPTLAAR